MSRKITENGTAGVEDSALRSGFMKVLIMPLAMISTRSGGRRGRSLGYNQETQISDIGPIYHHLEFPTGRWGQVWIE